MRKEIQKVVQAVGFGCIVGIPTTLLLINKFDLSHLWAVLLGIVFMTVSTVMYDPKDTWSIFKSTWSETWTWRPNKMWWKLIKIHYQGHGAIMLALSAWVLTLIISVFGLVAMGLVPPTAKTAFIFIYMVLLPSLGGYLGGATIATFTEMSHCSLNKTAMEEAEKSRDFSYARARKIFHSLMISPVVPLIWVFETAVRMPNYWHYSGKPFICLVFTRLATAGRKVTFFCTGIGFATGVSYGLFTNIGYFAPTVIGTITGVTIAIFLVEIIPLKILKLQVR